MKDRAEDLGLRSRRRVRGAGRISGGTSLDRGHIHHFLTNLIYAGRIRHKGPVYEGQHPAIIELTAWETVQRLLAQGSARTLGTSQKARRSPLAGMLFDETGDRLPPPSHSKKNGKRLCYYISRRLVTDRSRKHPGAWRLPAEQLERLLVYLVRTHLARPDAATRMIGDLPASEVTTTARKLGNLKNALDCLALIERVDLRPGSLALRLSHQAIAGLAGFAPDRIHPDELTLDLPFRMRRRGVELKLYLGDAPPEVDRILVQNIVKARRWLALIIDGKTFAEIAETEGTSRRRVHDVIDLALLAPDILDGIASGEQPVGLTTDYLIKSGFPAIWSEQREQFAAL